MAIPTLDLNSGYTASAKPSKRKILLKIMIHALVLHQLSLFSKSLVLSSRPPEAGVLPNAEECQVKFEKQDGATRVRSCTLVARGG
jgi:hypothetical protein